jgi:hypothetical protein
MTPADLFVSQSTSCHSAGISCTTHELFCPQVVLCGTRSETSVAPSQLTQFWHFQDTERFLIPCPCHVSSRLPPNGEGCKYATVPSTQKSVDRFSTYLYAQLSIPQKMLGTPPEDDNVMPKHVGATIHN